MFEPTRDNNIAAQITRLTTEMENPTNLYASVCSVPKEVKRQSGSGEGSGRAETDIVAVLGRYGVAAV